MRCENKFIYVVPSMACTCPVLLMILGSWGILEESRDSDVECGP